MSRPPFLDTFETEKSPLTPQSAGPSTPVSYQANVNRQKTKKWVEAKSVDYGGDDWGDDYGDEYHDDDPPPPLPKVTGFRQPGQGINTDTTNKKTYGELPSLPSLSREAPDRSATNPPLLRKNSFSKDDERRAFSSGPSHRHQASSASTATITPTSATSAGPQAQTISTQPSITGLRKAVPSPIETQSPPVEAHGSFTESARSSAHTLADTPSVGGDVQIQQPFSQSDIPSPLRTRALSPQARTASPLGRRSSSTEGADLPAGRSVSPAVQHFAPRKSSLSQASAPDLSDIIRLPSQEARQEAPAAKPWTAAPRATSPGAAGGAPAAKALPFIRPADIYKRLEEERQRERQSLESSRPSMDSIMGRNPDRESSPAPVQAAIPTISVPAEHLVARGRRGSGSGHDDLLDSGRRLAPMLEPVQERKSEYDFDAMAAKSPEAAYMLQQEIQKPESPSQQFQPYRPGASQNLQQYTYPVPPSPQQSKAEPLQPQYPLSVEENRPYSISPKLPDLQRMSGFGIDLWSQPKPDDSEASNTFAAASQPNETLEQHPLRKQPSLGFTSVVHQAFDRNDSLPETPSVGPGDVRRTNSESTTAGISPIMSRVPSIGRDRSLEGRETSTPAIAEEHEPDSRRTSANFAVQQPIPKPLPKDEPSQVPFHLGHRRDISTPSPGNSPAKTPYLEIAEKAYSGEEAQISKDAAIIPEAEIQDPKTLTERNDSFRPVLPGSWVSYVTSDSEDASASETPYIERSEIIGGNIMVNTQNQNFASVDDDMDVSPTKATPDPVLAPVGDHCVAPVADPYSGELQYQLQEISPKTSEPSEAVASLQPPYIDRISIASSTGPEEEDLPPPVPLKDKSADGVIAKEELAAPVRSAVLPTLTTNASPLDEETDKLNKEIARSSSPQRTFSEPSAPGFVAPPIPADETHLTLSVPSPGAPRESMYLPSEYDNYWAATEEEEAESQLQKLQQAEPVSAASEISHMSSVGPIPIGPEHAEDLPPILPLSTKHPLEASVAPIPAVLEHRFSWEIGPEQVTAENASSQASTPAAPLPPALDLAPLSPERAYAESETSRLHADAPTQSDSASPAPLSIRSEPVSDIQSDKPSQDNAPENIAGTAALAATAGAAVAATAVAFVRSGSSESGQAEETVHQSVPINENILVDSQDPVNGRSRTEDKADVYPVISNPEGSAWPSPQKIVSMLDVGPSQQALPQAGPSPTIQVAETPQVSQLTQPTHHSYGPRPLNPTEVPKPKQFREIMGLGSAEQRIRAYNETRQQYAAMDSGLAEWIRLTSTQSYAPSPSFMHAAAAQNDAYLRPRSTSKSGNIQPLQPPPQPYYQQYLNASTPSTPVGPPSRQSTGIPTGSQGFSSGGGMTTQLMQAKSKELLHSAGIFGGKASKAGRGLLAKGKSRFMGSGDKESHKAANEAKASPSAASPALQDKPKSSRRSSWAFPLTSHHFSGRPGSGGVETRPSSVARNSISDGQRHRVQGSISGKRMSTSLSRAQTNEYSLPLPRGVHSEVGQGSSSTSTPPGPHFLELNLSHSSLRDERWGSTSASIEDGSSKDRIRDGSPARMEKGAEQEKDELGPAAPIAKYQPSWDSFNARPIAGEEGLGWDSPYRGLRHSGQVYSAAVEPSKNEQPRAGILDNDKGPEERRVSEDWVIVSPDEAPHVPGAFPESPTGRLKPGDTVDMNEVSAMTIQGSSKDDVPMDLYQAAAVSFIQTDRQQPNDEVRPFGLAAGADISPQDKPLPPVTESARTVHLSSDDVSQEDYDHEERNQESSSSGFGLPPIRRSSTFGFGLLTKPAKERSSMDDGQPDHSHESQVVSPVPQSDASGPRDNQTAVMETTFGSAFAARVSVDTLSSKKAFDRYSFQDESHMPQQEVLSRPSLVPAGSSDYDVLKTDAPTANSAGQYPPRTQYPAEQDTVPTQRPYVPLNTGSQFPAHEQFQGQPIQNKSMPPSAHQHHSSLDAQQRMRSPSNSSQGRGVPFNAPGPYQQMNQGSSAPFSAPGQYQRPSLESQRSRPPSMSGVYQPPKITPQYTENPPPSFIRAGPAGIPPSSAERYPELFQQQQDKNTPIDYSGDLASEYPVPEKEYIARQQAIEYQLPGIGPPSDDPRNPDNRQSRRNSGFFKELGGRLSRGSSRDRRLSHMEDDGSREIRALQSRDSIASSGGISHDDPEKTEKRHSRRNSVLAALSLTSRGVTPDIPPQSRESMVTHRPNSRIDQLTNPPLPHSPLVPIEKKRTFFGKADNGSGQKESKKLSRQSTIDMQENSSEKQAEKPAKERKHRFSSLSSLFSSKKGDNDKNSAAEVSWLPSALPGVMLKVKNEQDKQAFSEQGLLKKELPKMEWSQLLAEQSQSPSTGNRAHVVRTGPIGNYMGEYNADLMSNQPMQAEAALRQQIPVPLGIQAQNADRPPQIGSNRNPQVVEMGRHASLPLKEPSVRQQDFQESLEKQRTSPVAGVGLNEGENHYMTPSTEPVNRQIEDEEEESFVTALSGRGSAAKVDPNEGVHYYMTSSTEPINRQREEPESLMKAARRDPAAEVGRIDSDVLVSPRNGDVAATLSSKEPTLWQIPAEDSSQQLSTLPGMKSKIQVPLNLQQQQVMMSRPQENVGGIPPQGGPPGALPWQQMPPAGNQQQPPTSQKRNPEVPHGFLQKHRTSDSQSSSIQPEAKPKKGGLFSGLLGGRRNSGLSEKQSSRPQVATVQQQPPQGQPPHLQQGQQNRQFDPLQQQQHQLPPQNRGPISGAFQQQQIYETPPIPGAYSLVRGEGQLAPTGYDPRGLNQQYHYSQPQHFADQRSYDEYMRQQHQQQQWQAGHYQGHQYAPQQYPPQGFAPQPFHPGQPQLYQDTSFAQPPVPEWKRAPNHTGPGPGPQGLFSHLSAAGPPIPDTPDPQDPRPRPFLGLNKEDRGRLSMEDLLARSPARAQFGQQAPYQLSLPGGDEEEYSPHARRMPKSNPLRKDTIPLPGYSGAQTALPTSTPHPSAYPLPDSVFSPINAQAQDFPPPPPPKWPGGTTSSHPYPNLTPPTAGTPVAGLDRSNTVTSDVSQLSSGKGHGDAGVSPPTTTASPDMVAVTTVGSPAVPVPGQEEDLYGVSPRSTPGTTAAQAVRPGIAQGQVQRVAAATERGVMQASGSQKPLPLPRLAVDYSDEKIYDDSREEKIVVEDANVRRVNGGGVVVEEEVPKMSATSFPGDEWRPWGYEEGGYE